MDAITWIKAAVSEIKPDTVLNCFKSCGFPVKSDEDENFVADEDENTITNEDEELQDLVYNFSPDLDDKIYAEIDNNIETENYSVNILDFISKDDSEDEQESEKQQKPTKIIDDLKASAYLDKLKGYFLHNKNTISYQNICSAQMRFDSLQVKKPRKQKTITDYLKK
uniref:DDE-1 domain-containing protein n=1 Tax=Trichogramma kaykai TaxID=54128 RepID=A0ABD2X1T4_9HYME